MADTTSPKLDLAQRIIEAINRTTDPLPTAVDIAPAPKEGQQVIGVVPFHLRHLHNLLVEQAKAVHAAQAELDTMRAEKDVLRKLFFLSLDTHVTQLEDANGMSVLGNWDVIADLPSEDEDNPLMMIASLLGGSLKSRRT